ncbi:MAG: metallophosphoesterase [Planctomycetes bacterium]|nr:metallophosphoesterase [Planctomycetota bacterium]
MAQVALCLLALLGHFALWVGLLNRLHSFFWPHWLREVLEKVILVALLGVLVLAVAVFSSVPDVIEQPLRVLQRYPIAMVYFVVCCVVASLVSLAWVSRKWRGRPGQLISNHGHVIRVDRRLGHSPCRSALWRFWANVPGNQILQLEVNEKTIRVPGLPAELDGLRVAHLSDLHFTGRMGREYFDLIVDLTNDMRPDLVAVTGDIIDRPTCLPWFEGVLGRLQSRRGVFCILGNHERRLPDKSEIVHAIEAAGLKYLGGACTLVPLDGHEILLAGNELPWWGPEPDMTRCAEEAAGSAAVRILLAHTPDRIHWARKHAFDLMLAGHTHGGQICFPVIGPVVSQSRYGVSYASGLCSVAPTMLHVSRGLSGCQPLRIQCRPELILLVLRSELKGDHAGCA